MKIDLITQKGLNKIFVDEELVAETFNISTAAEIVELIAKAETACVQAKISFKIKKNKDSKEIVDKGAKKNEG